MSNDDPARQEARRVLAMSPLELSEYLSEAREASIKAEKMLTDSAGRFAKVYGIVGSGSGKVMEAFRLAHASTSLQNAAIIIHDAMKSLELGMVSDVKGTISGLSQEQIGSMLRQAKGIWSLTDGELRATLEELGLTGEHLEAVMQAVQNEESKPEADLSGIGEE